MENHTFGTTPLLLHAPNDSNQFWRKTVKRFFLEQPQRQYGAVPDMTVFTWNSGSQPGVFEQSMERLGMPCTCLGRGVSDWTHLKKMQLLATALRYVTTPYVLAADSYDVLVLGDLRKSVERFLGMNRQICFNAAEVGNKGGLASSLAIEHECHRGKGRLRHLNSGLMIGKTEFCLMFYDIAAQLVPVTRQVINQWSGETKMLCNDQAAMKVASHLFYADVGLDHECRIFQIPYPWADLKVVAADD